MSTYQEFGQLRIGAALLVAAMVDGWTALQTRDPGSLVSASSTFRLAVALCLAPFGRSRRPAGASIQFAGS